MAVAADPTAAVFVFPGSGTGPIPDGLAGMPPPLFGAPLIVSFAVSGLQTNVTAVEISVTWAHTWVGGVDAVLSGPGGSASVRFVSRIGVTTDGSFGDSSNYNGTYGFDDFASGTVMANIWSVASGSNGNSPCENDCTVAVNTYRPTAPGQPGQSNPPNLHSMYTPFSGFTPAQANGTWTLTVRDASLGDTGSVTAANLILTTVPQQGDLDVDGNGTRDALTDGLLVIRYLFGFRGETLIASAVGVGCTRCTAAQIEAHLGLVF